MSHRFGGGVLEHGYGDTARSDHQRRVLVKLPPRSGDIEQCLDQAICLEEQNILLMTAVVQEEALRDDGN